MSETGSSSTDSDTLPNKIVQLEDTLEVRVSQNPLDDIPAAEDNTRLNAVSALPFTIVKHDYSMIVIKLTEAAISIFDQGYDSDGKILPISNDDIEGIENQNEVNSLH